VYPLDVHFQRASRRIFFVTRWARVRSDVLVNFVHMLLEGSRSRPERGKIALGALDFTEEKHDVIVRDA
jgi:hypothetical protein